MRQFLPLLLVVIATPALADCLDDIRSTLHLGLNSGPVRIDSMVTGAIEPWSQQLVAIPPEDVAIKATGFIAVTELVRTEGRTYRKIGVAWEEIPGEAGRTLASNRRDASILDLDAIANATCLGVTTVDGTDYLTFTYEQSRADSVGKVTLLADPATGRPVRRTTVLDMSGDVSTGVDLYTYDPTLTVTAPKL